MALPTQHLTRGSTRPLFRFLSSRVEEQTSRRSERHLASCNSLLSSAGFNLVAGTAASITLSGSTFSANTRINIVALGQACDGSVYQMHQIPKVWHRLCSIRHQLYFPELLHPHRGVSRSVYLVEREKFSISSRGP